MSKILDALGTSVNSFLIAIGGVRLKNTSGNLAVRNSGDTADAEITVSKLNNSGNTIAIGTTNILSLTRNTSQAGTLVLIPPPGKGTDGQVLAQKAGTGAGTIELEFISAAGTSQCVTVKSAALAFGSAASVAVLTLPVNAVVEAVRVIIDTPFNGTPSLSVGISGTTSKYLSANQVDLTAAAQTVFEVYPGRSAVGTTESIIATYAAGGASAGAARIEIDYVVPS